MAGTKSRRRVGGAVARAETIVTNTRTPPLISARALAAAAYLAPPACTWCATHSTLLSRCLDDPCFPSDTAGCRVAHKRLKPQSTASKTQSPFHLTSVRRRVRMEDYVLPLTLQCLSAADVRLEGCRVPGKARSIGDPPVQRVPTHP